MKRLGGDCVTRVWIIASFLLLGLPLVLGLIPEVARAAGENQQQIPVEASPQNPGGVGELPDEVSESVAEEGSEIEKQININYFGIFYGPALQGTNSYQPAPGGQSDRDLPVILKNFLNVGHNLSEMVTVTATAYWVAQPVLDKNLEFQDPFVRASYNSILHWRGFNLYGDVRGHVPATAVSQQNDLVFGLQTFQALTYGVPESRFLYGLYASERRNFFGNEGYGNDVELYFALNMNYQFAPTLTTTLLFEVQRNHAYGDFRKGFYDNGTDIQPGISWDITPQIMVNPYLNILLGQSVSLRSTSVGMMMSWTLL